MYRQVKPISLVYRLSGNKITMALCEDIRLGFPALACTRMYEGHLNASCLPGLNVQVKLNLLGVEGPGDHPDDAVSHRPGEPGSVRGEVHAPCLASGSAHQGRRTPGLELQDERRVGGWRKRRKRRKGVERHGELSGWHTHASPTLDTSAEASPPASRRLDVFLSGGLTFFFFSTVALTTAAW